MTPSDPCCAVLIARGSRGRAHPIGSSLDSSADVPVSELVALLADWFQLLTEVATEAAEKGGTLGPFSPPEVATLIGSSFIGAGALLLLGFDRHQLPIRTSLRRVGELIRRGEEGAGQPGEPGA